ncbi:hypothetical protein [Desulfobacula phenolica]|uniref:Uncharacterized protein n=1 Tax=Desulfobacula phenolica TaxID=90732 RepID=A0A1H2IU16_9BACT|nr:hypothetical protein [Desulfobacula phenolica]SDU47593.1 hypothetical protein SAMN04487931_109176 [Desulfobacula phenolica]
MDPIATKAKQWIDEKRDPRSAYWQAALEANMDLFSPDLEKGKLTPVHSLEEKDLPVFKAALEVTDLSPGLLAAFLTPTVANAIIPPDSAEELMRIEKGKPSYKIIILRPGKEERIICIEISEHAHKPGMDIFQSGALLGTFDYQTHEICLSELTKAIRAHAWEKDKWQHKDHIAYTLNWFEKIEYLGKSDVSVDKTRSVFHSPTLIRTNRVDALFLIIYETLHKRFQENFQALSQDLISEGEGKNSEDKKTRLSACHTLAETSMLDLLNMVKKFNLLDFTSFNDAESRNFKNEFVRTARKLSSKLDEMMKS